MSTGDEAVFVGPYGNSWKEFSAVRMRNAKQGNDLGMTWE